MPPAEIKHKKKKRLGSYPNMSVIFSISLALFVIGLFGLLLLHANNLSQLIQQNVEVQVYLNKYLSENDKIQLQKILASKEYILKNDGNPSIEFVSKEEAADQFIEDTGEDIIKFLGENPLRDVFILKIIPAYQKDNRLSNIKKDIEQIDGVFEVTYVENLVSSINRNVAKISLVLIAFATILLITITFLINNTIKLALFSQRFLIRSMQLVGAKTGFIKNPFLLRATFQGFIAGIIASLLLFGLIYYGNQKIEDLNKLQNIEEIIILFVILIVIGSLVGLFSTLKAVNKYLKMSLDELY